MLMHTVIGDSTNTIFLILCKSSLCHQINSEAWRWCWSTLQCLKPGPWGSDPLELGCWRDLPWTRPVPAPFGLCTPRAVFAVIMWGRVRRQVDLLFECQFPKVSQQNSRMRHLLCLSAILILWPICTFKWIDMGLIRVRPEWVNTNFSSNNSIVRGFLHWWKWCYVNWYFVLLLPADN